MPKGFNVSVTMMRERYLMLFEPRCRAGGNGPVFHGNLMVYF